MLLIKILQQRSTFGWVLSNLVALLRWNLFTYRSLWEWINRPFLAGIDSVSASQRDARAAFSAGKAEAVSLVLVDEPEYIDQLSRLVPVDLQLSGHTHRRAGSYFRPRRNDSSGEGPNVRRRFVPCRSEPGLDQPRDRNGRRSFRFKCPPEVAEITLCQP
jgi:hypothetical protein